MKSYKTGKKEVEQKIKKSKKKTLPDIISKSLEK